LDRTRLVHRNHGGVLGAVGKGIQAAKKIKTRAALPEPIRLARLLLAADVFPPICHSLATDAPHSLQKLSNHNGHFI
jgi:hypothetical protein